MGPPLRLRISYPGDPWDACMTSGRAAPKSGPFLLGCVFVNTRAPAALSAIWPGYIRNALTRALSASGLELRPIRRNKPPDQLTSDQAVWHDICVDQPAAIAAEDLKQERHHEAWA